MTPHEKAVTALNGRLERLQASLRESKDETAQQLLLQSIVVTLGLSEALNDYIKAVGAYAQRRHGELKQVNDTLGAQHAELLKIGQEQLARLKENPTDRALQKQIARTQQQMEAIQKNVRRGANSLRRDVAPGLAMIDDLAVSIRRFCEADDSVALKRVLKSIIEQVHDLYRAQPDLPSRAIIDAGAWEKSALSTVEQARGFDDAYTRGGHYALIGLDLMTFAVSENPPRNAEESLQRANESVTARIKAITGRLTGA